MTDGPKWPEGERIKLEGWFADELWDRAMSAAKKMIEARAAAIKALGEEIGGGSLNESDTN